ncbi:MAG: hypothetical protein EOO65_00765 [Methanosarcinales archaeon]|nr:MAG: hypothetical protein EOO65_00765 [Methanosarcinales archaeon]
MSLPGAVRSSKISISKELDVSDFLELLKASSLTRDAMAGYDPTKLEVRVVWKDGDRIPTIQQYLACPPVDARFPLLDQVHEVGAGGRVKEKPAAWNNFTPRGGYFYVHVHNTAPRVVSGALVGPFRPVHSRQLCWLVC